MDIPTDMGQGRIDVLRCHPEITKYGLNKEPMLSFSSLEISPSRRKVFLNQQEIKLTVKEYEILLLLATNQSHVLTYSQIYETVWGDLATGNERDCISFHICNLRAKLHTTSLDTTFRITSVREVGYIFEVPTKSERQ